MHKVTDEEMDFMLQDMKNRGVHSKDLQENLLDHMCCIIEQEMDENADFKKFYRDLLPRFFNHELAEIQTETTQLLRFKHYYSMKKTLNIAGIATVAFTFFGALLKTFHLPGAAICIVLGGFFFSFLFLPLLILLKFRDDESTTDKAVFSFGLIMGIAMSIGVIFKLQHWPGANVLMISSTVAFTFVYVPLYFFTRFNRPDLKFNTLVNTVLMFAIGGIFFALFDLSFSRTFSKEISQNHFFIHENSERIFESNKRLFSFTPQSENAQHLHNSTIQVNDQIEVVAAIVVHENTARNAVGEIQTLETMLAGYNGIVQSIQFDNLTTIDDKGIKVLDRLSSQLALNTLARVQHQLAVNENCYLSSTQSGGE